MITRDTEVQISELSKAEELSGKLQFNDVDDKLMHSVIENDKQVIEEGKLLEQAFNQGLSSFTPDMMFEQMVRDYKLAEKIYGDRLLRQIFGYDPDELERNIKIPEFQRELKRRMEETLDDLKKKKLLDKDNTITEKGLELASLVVYVEELDNMMPKGLAGEKIHKKYAHYGDKGDVYNFKKGSRYKDISIRRSLKKAVRRGHSKIEVDDLQVHERIAKGQCYIIYAIDSSGSMKGRKIGVCKRAGVALAHKAISERDKVGLIIFGDEVKATVDPTLDFTSLLKEITKIKASKETDIAITIQKAVEMFPRIEVTKHLLLLTDALPTIGSDPEKNTLEAASFAKSSGVTISLIGINLDEKGRKLAEKITEIGQGRFYTVADLKDVDKLVLQDYYSVY